MLKFFFTPSLSPALSPPANIKVQARDLLVRSLPEESPAQRGEGEGAASLLPLGLSQAKAKTHSPRRPLFIAEKQTTPPAEPSTLSFDLWAKGSAQAITDWVFERLSPEVEDVLWNGRARDLMAGLVPVLVNLRDQSSFTLSPQVVRDHLALERLDQFAVSDAPAELLAPLKHYLSNLPDYATTVHTECGDRHTEITCENHGFLQMQFARVLHEEEPPENLSSPLRPDRRADPDELLRGEVLDNPGMRKRIPDPFLGTE